MVKILIKGLDMDEMVKIMSGGEFKTMNEFKVWASQHNGDYGPLTKAAPPIKSFREYPPLEMSDMPRFDWEKAPLGDDIKKVLIKITVMTVCGIVLFFLSFVSFTHYDVR